MRVNNVRKAFELYNPGTLLVPSFVDSSLWERRKLESPESIKALIRDGVINTSVVCVLIGTETWLRRWVRYEIARSVVDGKGLLAVDINGINHHRDRVPHQRGSNPLDWMGIGRVADGSYRLFERTPFRNGGFFGHRWMLYGDYTREVPLPKYMGPLQVGTVKSLSTATARYDFAAQNGAKAIGGWLDFAASIAGR